MIKINVWANRRWIFKTKSLLKIDAGLMKLIPCIANTNSFIKTMEVGLLLSQLNYFTFMKCCTYWESGICIGANMDVN